MVIPIEHFLHILPFERIAKKVGVMRLSRDGAEELREVVEEMAVSIAEQATRVALHAGRKTVMREDVEFVAGKVQVTAETAPQAQSKPAAQEKSQQIKASATQPKDENADSKLNTSETMEKL